MDQFNDLVSNLQYSNFAPTAEILSQLNFDGDMMGGGNQGVPMKTEYEPNPENVDPALFQSFLNQGGLDLSALLGGGPMLPQAPPVEIKPEPVHHEVLPSLDSPIESSNSPKLPTPQNEIDDVYTSSMQKVMDADDGETGSEPRLLCLWLTNSSIKPWFRPSGGDGSTGVSYGSQRLRKERTHPTMSLRLTIPYPESYNMVPFRADHHPKVELIRCDANGVAMTDTEPIEASPVTFSLVRAPLFQFLESQLVVYYQVAIHITCHDLKCTLFRLRIVCPSIGLKPVDSSPLLIGTGANPILPGSIGLPVLRSSDVSYIRVSRPARNPSWSLSPSTQIVKIEGANFTFGSGHQLVFEVADVEDASNCGYGTVLSLSENTVIVTPPALRGPCEAILRAYVDYNGSRLHAVGTLPFTYTPVPNR